MSQASDRFNISFSKARGSDSNRVTLGQGSPKNKPVTSDRFNVDIPVKNFVPMKSQLEGDGDIGRYAHHKKPEYRSADARFIGIEVPHREERRRENVGSSERFGAIEVPDREERRRENPGSSDRFGTIEVPDREERRRENNGPSDRFAAIEMQDPRRMARKGIHQSNDGQPQTKISIRNTFVDLIDQAIVTKKTIAPVPQIVSDGGSGSDIVPNIPKKKQVQQSKKKNQSSMDDLDDDFAVRTATNKALVAKYGVEEEEDVSDNEDDENTGPLTKAERKAAKQQRKREKLEAAGYGYLYSRD